jgi:hypothetical protein
MNIPAARRWRRNSFTRIHASYPVIAVKLIYTDSEFIMIHNMPTQEKQKKI